MILFGDFKQLPPATTKPPFIILDTIHQQFEFRMLRENRRVIQGDVTRNAELQEFHEVLHDISYGLATERVRNFFVSAYVRGAMDTAENVEFEGSTAVFTKRKFRNKWNNKVTSRIAQAHNHTLTIRGRCLHSRADNGSERYVSDRRLQVLRSEVRTQSPFVLHLAGDWSTDPVDATRPHHRMRVMLTANLDVERRFANGTQGRISSWEPRRAADRRKGIQSTELGLQARFLREDALHEISPVPGCHFLDVERKHENTGTAKQPVLVQLPLIPAYSLTAHKVQALSIAHTVHGCFEGVFAHGQVYVIVSRVTDPRNFRLVGLPPKDMLDEVMHAWANAGLHVRTCLRNAAETTGDW